jgi:molecular chaperone DnaK (HSP70)
MISPAVSSPPRFVVGIDLGTTNSAVAFADTRMAERRVRLFPVVQWVAPGEWQARDVLPSFHYSPVRGELPASTLPWESEFPGYVTGVLAREQGANVPGRLIVSAKSWLSHSGVDRTANFLPWQGAADVEKLSPAEVTARYLGHIRAAWNHAWPEHLLEHQDLVITIPASFDEIARELTVAAARKAGLPRVVLLEEPQAAFYSWIHKQGEQWDKRVKPGQRILVCDIGGGTTDFTLIQAQPSEKGHPRFHRFAVGEHLILGGDNLDLALAHFIEQKDGHKLEARQWTVLVRKCQHLKELMLGDSPPESCLVNIPSTGARLISGALNVEVTRAEVAQLLVEAFAPRVKIEEKPIKRRSGFQEFGLPYAPDHAITRYLAAFLTAHAGLAEGNGQEAVRPDVVLLNGGLFESAQMRQRLVEVLSSWFGGPDSWAPLVLENERLDLAVAIGAAYYGLVRRGLGVRITGGLPRSYYIGVQQEEKLAALCLVPAGMEEGQEIQLERSFQLLIRQPVEFPLFVSSLRTTDQPGAMIEIDPGQLSPLPPIRTVLRAGKHAGARETAQVILHGRLTEIGTLELWCSEVDGSRKWKLDFDVRSATQTDQVAHAGEGERAGFIDENNARQCLELVEFSFSRNPVELPPERLVKRMEEVSGLSRHEWPPSLLRRIWETLLSLEETRHRSVSHEGRWLNLLGFCLRPGYGMALDDWRVAQTWNLFPRKVSHANNELCRAEWWILWRRIAGGLVPGQQRMLAEPLISALKSRSRSEKGSQRGGKSKSASASEFRFGPHETQEVWRLLGALELLAQPAKSDLADFLSGELARKGLEAWDGAGVWALGRIGARVPMHASLNAVLPPETVEPWIRSILQAASLPPAVFLPLMLLCRRTDDRYRDIPDALRKEVLERLSGTAVPAHFLKLIRETGELETTEKELVFGETLPPGLRL